MRDEYINTAITCGTIIGLEMAIDIVREAALIETSVSVSEKLAKTEDALRRALLGCRIGLSNTGVNSNNDME